MAISKGSMFLVINLRWSSSWIRQRKLCSSNYFGRYGRTL